MKTLQMTTIFLIMMVATALFGGTAVADDCRLGAEMVAMALTKPPNDMTPEYINQGIALCSENRELYKEAADYYIEWLRKEHNPEIRQKYKTLAKYYASKGKVSIDRRIDVADKAFSKPAFRALRPASAGDTGKGLKLKVLFRLNSTEVSNVAQHHLDQLGEFLRDHASVRVSLEGHTCMKGGADYNQNLSIKRAENVKRYLIYKYGISSSRIVACGYGFDRLINTADPYSSENRRVELIKLSE